MEFRFSINGNDMRMVHYKCFLSGNYLLEPINRLQVRSQAYLDEQGNVVPAPESTIEYRDSLEKYIFTDINLKQSTEFSLSDTPEVINTYPSVQKKSGYSFAQAENNEVLPQLVKEISNFYFVNDTTINGFKYKILEDTIIREYIDNHDVRKVKIYLNQDLPNFPLHLLSTKLDNKFNGICTKFVLYDTGNNVTTGEWLITKEQDSKIQEMKDKYIVLCNHSKGKDK